MLNSARLIISAVIFSVCVTLSLSAQATSFNAAGIRMNKKVKTLKEVKQQNVVTQSLDFSCGAAGLSTLFNYYLNDPITETQILSALLKIVPLEKVKARQGFSLLDLKKFSEAIGYKVTGYRMDMEFLKSMKQPILVPIKFKNYKHFVIIKAVIADRVYIADPAVGNLSLKIDKFERIWNNGIGLVIEHPKKDIKEYALKVDNKSAVFAEYNRIRNFVNQTLIQTAIFPNEY